MAFGEIFQSDDSYWFYKNTKLRYKVHGHKHTHPKPQKPAPPQSESPKAVDRSETCYLHGGLMVVSTA